MKLAELKDRRVKLNDQATAIRAKAEAEGRDLTVQETDELDQALDAFQRATDDIARLEKLDEQTETLATPTGRKTAPNQPAKVKALDDEWGEGDEVNTPRPQSRNRLSNRPTHDHVQPRILANGGFDTLGHMAQSVRVACLESGVTDPRLHRLAAATTYGSEGSGADGGWAIPPDFRTGIMTTLLGEDSLLSRCDQVPCAGNNFTCPVDETSPWQTSGGILATWDGEAAAATQSKPALQEVSTKLHKLRVLVPVTEELLDDAVALDAYLRNKAPQKMAFKVNSAIISGTGAGMPLGVLNSPSLITQAAEAGQQATTLVANNVIKMWSRMYAPLRSSSVWIINQDIEPQLLKLSIPGTDNTGNAVTGWGSVIYLPANGLAGGPNGSLFGRPIVYSQACSTLGTPGDIIFASMPQYLALLKSGPNPRLDISVHLWFDQDLVAYRFILRMGGKPWWSTTVSALNGSNTYSPFVALASR